MAPVYLATALLLLVTALVSAPAAAAQDGGYPGPALPTGTGAPGLASCARGAVPDPSAYAYGPTACRPAAIPDTASRDYVCTNLAHGTSGLLYSSRLPYYAPGGEAYSSSGYGSGYSPSLTAPDPTAPASGASGDSSVGATPPPACA